jgi:hypothetical protein
MLDIPYYSRTYSIADRSLPLVQRALIAVLYEAYATCKCNGVLGPFLWEEVYHICFPTIILAAAALSLSYDRVYSNYLLQHTHTCTR